MRTLIDIDEDLMNTLLKEANTRVKKEAIVKAIQSFIDMKRRERLASLIGRFAFGYTAEDLQEMREDG